MGQERKHLRPLLQKASQEAVAQESQRYRERAYYGDRQTTTRSMLKENAFLGHRLNSTKATEDFVESKLHTHDLANTIGYALQRLHDGVLNPEGFATLPEHVIHGIESLGLLGKIVFEDIEGLNLGVDFALLGAKMASADSTRAKFSAGADIVLDNVIPVIYPLAFNSGNNELARDRVDERADVGAVKAIKSVLLSQDPALSEDAQKYAESFVAAMETPHAYHDFVHTVLSQTQKAIKPFAMAHKAAQNAGPEQQEQLHALAEDLLARLKIDTSKLSAKELVDMGDRLHEFATTELQAPRPMTEYVSEIVAIAPEAAKERNEQAMLKGRRMSSEKKALLLDGARWEHAGQVGQEILETYELAKQRLAGKGEK